MRTYGFHEREEEKLALGRPSGRIAEKDDGIPRGFTMGVAV
jgi:hypothetical protein